ncbi:MAG: hypothetical protein R2784_07810 [Saprospiraceae bacterium]
MISASICEGEVYPVATQQFSSTGLFTINTTSNSGCDSIVELNLNVIPNVESDVDTTICNATSIAIGNQTFDQSGQFDVLLQSAAGCDSLVHLNLTVRNKIESNLSITICDGDNFVIGGLTFDTEGLYEVSFTSFSGCDSTVNLELLVENCALINEVITSPVSCFGGNNGQFDISFSNGVFPVNVQWSGNGIMGDTTITNVSQTITIQNLPSGIYQLTFTDSLNVVTNESVVVNSPTELFYQVNTSSFGNHEVSCFAEADGYVLVSPSGGSQGYQIVWENGSSENPRQNLAAGNYRFTVTDANGCPKSGI